MSQEVLNVRISDEQKAELERIAETQGATVSEIIRGLLDGELQTEMLQRSSEVNGCLDRLFSPRQKDLVFKKLNSQAFTKTEREYYSRVVRKKLKAIANSQVGYIATKLTQK